MGSLETLLSAFMHELFFPLNLAAQSCCNYLLSDSHLYPGSLTSFSV